MESLGVIGKVDELTSWCAGMVVVPKKRGEVRICVDFRKLNESVLREVHPLLKVDTLAKLTGVLANPIGRGKSVPSLPLLGNIASKSYHVESVVPQSISRSRCVATIEVQI